MERLVSGGKERAWLAGMDDMDGGDLLPPGTITAAAHQLAILVYRLLKYVQRWQEEYEAQRHERQVKSLKRMARLLGLEVVERAAAASELQETTEGS